MTDLDSGADLHDLMDRVLSDLPTPTDQLHAGAVRVGRPLRRRRRLWTAAGSVAIAAALAAVAVPFLGGSGPAPAGVAVEPPPQAKVPPFPGHPGWWDMPVGEMRQRLLALLPDDVEITAYARINTDHGPGESNRFAGVFNGTLRDANDVGPGSVSIMLAELPTDARALADLREQELSCGHFPDDWDISPPDGAVCETSEMRDRTNYRRDITYVYQGVTYREIRRWTDHGSIYTAVSSSTERKWGPPASAIDAPLTLAELQAVATSPGWTDWQPPS
jgi:hypothetical protein